MVRGVLSARAPRKPPPLVTPPLRLLLSAPVLPDFLALRLRPFFVTRAEERRPRHIPLLRRPATGVKAAVRRQRLYLSPVLNTWYFGQPATPLDLCVSSAPGGLLRVVHEHDELLMVLVALRLHLADAAPPKPQEPSSVERNGARAARPSRLLILSICACHPFSTSAETPASNPRSVWLIAAELPLQMLLKRRLQIPAAPGS